MEIELPKEVILLGEKYKIKQISKNEHPLKCSKCSEECIGTLDFSAKTIYIAIDDEENLPIETFLHELGHYFGLYVDGGKSEAFANMFQKYVLEIIKQIEVKEDKVKFKAKK